MDQIKHHPFFYGVNWGSIRTIEAPFVPRLRSITDTSYFPTDELEQVPEEPTGGDASAANKDLAFLGYVLSSASENSLCRDRSLGHDVSFSFFLAFIIDTRSSDSQYHPMHSDSRLFTTTTAK